MNYKFGEYIKNKESDFLGTEVNGSDLIRISDANNYYNSYIFPSSNTECGPPPLDLCLHTVRDTSCEVLGGACTCQGDGQGLH